MKNRGAPKDGGQVPQDNELISKDGVNELCNSVLLNTNASR